MKSLPGNPFRTLFMSIPTYKNLLLSCPYVRILYHAFCILIPLVYVQACYNTLQNYNSNQPEPTNHNGYQNISKPESTLRAVACKNKLNFNTLVV